MKIMIGHSLSLATPHKWWAWHPVVARRVTPSTIEYHVVWLSTVTRHQKSMMGVTKFIYELDPITVNQEHR